jgi:hypothetical protein
VVVGNRRKYGIWVVAPVKKIFLQTMASMFQTPGPVVAMVMTSNAPSSFVHLTTNGSMEWIRWWLSSAHTDWRRKGRRGLVASREYAYWSGCGEGGV